MGNSIRAKFKCGSVTDNGWNKSANLTAVFGKKGENADYAKATPFGNLTITIDKDTKASEFFEPQKDYWLVFSPVKED